MKVPLDKRDLAKKNTQLFYFLTTICTLVIIMGTLFDAMFKK